MRTRATPLLMALALALAGTGTALAQSDSGDNGMSILDGRSGDALHSANSASDGALSGNGGVTYTDTSTRTDIGVSASPTTPVHTGTGEPARSRISRLARLVDNGTSMSYGQNGANAIGNTGGMTTGPRGSAGIVAGGGSVHTAQGVVSPGPNNGRLTDDPPARTPRVALGGDDAQERVARSVGSDHEEHGGLRNRLPRSDDAEEQRARAALNGEDTVTPAATDDAQERAARAAATNRDEEEHGGFWNRLRGLFHHDDD